eukprot:1720563-Rhodomonas_salina.1
MNDKDIIRKVGMKEDKPFKLIFTDINDKNNETSFTFKDKKDFIKKYDEIKKVLPDKFNVELKYITFKYKIKVKKDIDDDIREDIKKNKAYCFSRKKNTNIKAKLNDDKDVDINIMFENNNKKPTPFKQQTNKIKDQINNINRLISPTDYLMMN